LTTSCFLNHIASHLFFLPFPQKGRQELPSAEQRAWHAAGLGFFSQHIRIHAQHLRRFPQPDRRLIFDIGHCNRGHAAH